MAAGRAPLPYAHQHPHTLSPVKWRRALQLCTAQPARPFLQAILKLHRKRGCVPAYPCRCEGGGTACSALQREVGAALHCCLCHRRPPSHLVYHLQQVIPQVPVVLHVRPARLAAGARCIAVLQAEQGGMGWHEGEGAAGWRGTWVGCTAHG